jgi:hypothetical protein
MAAPVIAQRLLPPSTVIASSPAPPRDLPPKLARDALLAAVRGHVLAEASLTGTHARS